MNDLFMEIRFSQGEEIYENVQVSLFLGRGTKGNHFLFLSLAFKGFQKRVSEENLQIQRVGRASKSRVNH